MDRATGYLWLGWRVTPSSLRPMAPMHRLGPIRFDSDTGEIFRDGERFRLRPQAATVLTTLMRRPGEMVTRAELQAAIWGNDRAEYDLGINVCIRQIRVALGDDADAPRYIETLPRRGYRLIAPVTVDQPDLGRRARPYRWPIAAVMVLGVATVGMWGRLGLGRSATPATMAVLPLRAMPQDDGLRYIQEGIAEDLITALAHRDPARLAVFARTTSFKLADDGLSPAAVGGKLGADYVLEGAVRRQAARYRVTVRLLSVRDGTYRWSRGYDLEADALPTLQYAVVEDVARSLALGRTDVAPTHPPHPAAADAILRARYLLSRFTQADAHAAVGFVHRALAADSTYAPAYHALAAARLQLGEVDAAEMALATARRIDDTADVAHLAGQIALYGRSDPWAALSHLTRAVAQQPGNAGIHRTYAVALAATGARARAAAHGEQALALDPISSTVRGDVGWIFYLAARYADARRVCRSTIELRPTSFSARECVVMAGALGGGLANDTDLVADLVDAFAAPAAQRTALLASISGGDHDSLWHWFLDRRNQAPGLSLVQQARLFALTGQPDDAVRVIREAARAGPRGLLWVAADPVFRDLHTVPEFREALEDVGLARALE